MLKEAVYHRLYSDDAYALSKGDLLIKIRTKKNDVDRVNIYYIDKYKFWRNKEVNPVAMKKVASDQLFDYFEGIIKHNFISVNYFFELISGDETLYYGNYLFRKEQPDDHTEFFNFPVMAERDLFVVPDWGKEAIVYQIFPERYCNGDTSNDPENVQPWYSKVNSQIMLGGDLKGITDKLDYIEELGVNVIYMTPIFLAGSNHKYNTYDYFQIDPQFGTLETFKNLVQEAHKRNIRIILDAVFNHSGTEFPLFQDVLEKGEESEYKDWFDIRKFPVVVKDNPDYGTFAYVGYMPKLMTKNEATKKYFIDVATYWIKEADIDGWRLDVADEIDHHFWRDFRDAVKAAKKDALIIGEVWYDSRAWLQGDEFDSVMNYVFTTAVKDFIVQDSITAEEFGERLGSIRGMYKIPAYHVLWNLIDSHDTPRFLTLAKEDKRRLMLAAFIQMTSPGIPMVYYGDEVGMVGAGDPDCRRGMLWDEEKQDRELLAYYQRLIKMRKENKTLTHGDFSTVYTDNVNNVYGFRRDYQGEAVEGYINNGDAAQEIKVKVQRKVVNLLTGEEYTPVRGCVTLTLPAKSAAILKI